MSLTQLTEAGVFRHALNLTKGGCQPPCILWAHSSFQPLQDTLPAQLKFSVSWLPSVEGSVSAPWIRHQLWMCRHPVILHYLCYLCSGFLPWQSLCIILLGYAARKSSTMHFNALSHQQLWWTPQRGEPHTWCSLMQHLSLLDTGDSWAGWFKLKVYLALSFPFDTTKKRRSWL